MKKYKQLMKFIAIITILIISIVYGNFIRVVFINRIEVEKSLIKTILLISITYFLYEMSIIVIKHIIFKKGKIVRCIINKKRMNKEIYRLSYVERQILYLNDDEIIIIRNKTDKKKTILYAKVNSTEYCLFEGPLWIDYINKGYFEIINE